MSQLAIAVRKLAILPAAVALIGAGLTQNHSQAAPTIVWGACSTGTPEGLQCGTTRVPLDHTRPQGKQLEVALIRQPAADQANRIGSLFIGHVFGTVGFVADAPPGALAAFSRFDVIGYDTRGAERSSTAIDCDTDRSLWQPFMTANLEHPGAMVKAARQYGEQCLDRHRDLLPHLTTTAMARDLDVLRAKVGDDKLTYIGISQGTTIGSTYASLFPGRIRAMVLDAPVDAELWRDNPLRAFRDQQAETSDVLDRFLNACAAAKSCAFGGEPHAAFDRLLTRLDRTPLPSRDPADQQPIDGDDLRNAVNNATYSPAFWQPLANALAEAERGDGTALRRAARFGFEAGLANDPVSPLINLWFANLAVDSRFPRSVSTYVRAGREARKLYPRIGSGLLASGYDLMIPALWPIEGRDVYRGPVRNRSDATILVIGGTHDAATPYHWAKELTRDLGNARLMTYESDGHGALNDGNLCLLIPVLTYLTDGTSVPPEGTVCHQTTKPFPAG